MPPFVWNRMIPSQSFWFRFPYLVVEAGRNMEAIGHVRLIHR